MCSEVFPRLLLSRNCIHAFLKRMFWLEGKRIGFQSDVRGTELSGNHMSSSTSPEKGKKYLSVSNLINQYHLCGRMRLASRLCMDGEGLEQVWRDSFSEAVALRRMGHLKMADAELVTYCVTTFKCISRDGSRSNSLVPSKYC